MSLKPRHVDFNTIWSELRETVGGVITLAHVPRKVWNDRFSDVYSLCVAHPEPLADRLYAETKQYLIEHVAKLLERVQNGGDDDDNDDYDNNGNDLATPQNQPSSTTTTNNNNNNNNSDILLIRRYHHYWSQYSVGTQYLHSLYLYLNLQHIRTQKLSDAEIIYGRPEQGSGEQMEIGELALEIWQTGMIGPLGQRLVRLILDEIEHDRAGQASRVPLDAIHGTIGSFVEVQGYKKKGQLQLYQELFEEPFLGESGEHFKRDAARLLEPGDVSAYMESVKSKIEEEQARARRFLHPTSHAKITQRCETHMVAEHLQFLYSKCTEMVQDERHQDLSNMYDLLKSIQHAMNDLVDTVLDHIKKQGLLAITQNNSSGSSSTTTDTTNISNNENAHMLFVENMLAVYKKYRKLIQNVFKADQNFMGALDKACSWVINHRVQEKVPCKSPEYLAKYCDTLLRKSSRGTVSDTEIDEKLTESITIFKYIDDKDVYQKFYARMLAKRLIHQQTQSMDAEEAMINRLKQACGYEFTSKLHRMFTDMSVSRDLNERFDAHLRQQEITLGVGFAVAVLQAGAWPLGQSALTVPFVATSYPRALERSVAEFEGFYHVRFNGRKLTWLHNLCQAELKLSYLRRTYVVTMQTFQMATLLLFEKCESLTYREVLESLQMNAEQYGRYATSLVDSKLLHADSTDLQPETVLRLNMEYSNKRTKFRINAAVQKESPQEIEHTMSSVEEDRKMVVQATIVRIMKSRKVLKHNALIQEVYTQSKASFVPSVQLIKKCIESLIDKQYIERTPHSSEEYSYVA